jgi:hypothetical protein
LIITMPRYLSERTPRTGTVPQPEGPRRRQS